MTLPAPSAAYYGTETDYASPATQVDVDHVFRCTGITGAWVCYEGREDYFWVKDEKADGYAAAIDRLVHCARCAGHRTRRRRRQAVVERLERLGRFEPPQQY